MSGLLATAQGRLELQFPDVVDFTIDQVLTAAKAAEEDLASVTSSFSAM